MSEAAKKLPENVCGGVPADKIMQVWFKAEPLLKRVVTWETGHSLQSVLAKLQLGTMQLWIVNDFQAVIVTSINELPLYKVLWIQFTVGNDMNEWMDDCAVVIEAYAKHNQCVAIELSGRRGWEKIRKKFPGYKHVLSTFRKVLT